MRVPHVLLVVALVISALLQGGLIIVQPLRIHVSPGPDSQEYMSIASHLVHDGTYSHDQEAPTRMRQPLYPLFLAAIWTVTGALHLQVVAAIQALLTVGSICLVYLIGLRLFNAVTAGVGAILVALYLPLAIISTLILTEGVYTFLLLGTSYFMLRWADENTVKAAALVGLGIGLMTLCRSTTLYLIPFLPVVLWLVSDRSPAQITKGMVALLAAALVLLPWGIRNYATFGDFSIMTSDAGITVWHGTQPDYFKYALYGGVKRLNNSPEGRLLRQGQYALSQSCDRRFRQAAYRHIRQHPWQVLGRGIAKVVIAGQHWAGTLRWLRTAPFWYGISVVTKIGFLALAVYGFQTAKRPGVWIIPVWVALFSAALVVVVPYSRYFIPLMPLIVVGAAEGLRRLGSRKNLPCPASQASQLTGE